MRSGRDTYGVKRMDQNETVTATCYIVYAHPILPEEKLVMDLHVLVNQLRAKGLQVFWDKDNAGQIGANISDSIQRIAAEHKHSYDYVLVVGTPDLVTKFSSQNHVVYQELVLVIKRIAKEDDIMRQHSELRRSILPIILSGSKEDALPRFLRDMGDQIVYATHERDNILEKVLSSIVPKDKRCLTYYNADTIYPIVDLPARNPKFIGRAKEFEQIHRGLLTGSTLEVSSTEDVAVPQIQALGNAFDMSAAIGQLVLSSTSQTQWLQRPKHEVVISGMGGIGKSQLAKAYAYAALDPRSKWYQCYQLIWWIDCQTKSIFDENYKRLGCKLGIETENHRIEDIIFAVHQALKKASPGNWLLIYDNARPEQLIGKAGSTQEENWLGRGGLPELLPPIGDAKCGHVLVTSRSPHWQGSILPLDVLTLDDALAYLEELIPKLLENQEKEKKLVQTLGLHPLAIGQAAGYIKSLGCSIDSYLDLFQRKRNKMLDDVDDSYAGIEYYGSTIKATIEIFKDIITKLQELESAGASTHVQKRGYLAKLTLELLNVGSLLAPGFAPMVLFKEYAKKQGYDPDLELLKALKLLESYGLITIQNAQAISGIMMHQLVQDIVCFSLQNEKPQSLEPMLLEIVMTNFTNAKNKNDENLLSQLSPHAVKMLLTVMPNAMLASSEWLQRSWEATIQYHIDHLAMRAELNLRQDTHFIMSKGSEINRVANCICVSIAEGQNQHVTLEFLQKIQNLLYQLCDEGINKAELVATLINLGHSLCVIDSHHNAIQLYNKAINIHNEVSEYDNIQRLKLLHAVACLKFKFGDLDSAHRFVRIALSEISNCLPPEDPYYRILERLGEMINLHKPYQLSLKHYWESKRHGEAVKDYIFSQQLALIVLSIMRYIETAYIKMYSPKC